MTATADRPTYTHGIVVALYHTKAVACYRGGVVTLYHGKVVTWYRDSVATWPPSGGSQGQGPARAWEAGKLLWRAGDFWASWQAGEFSGRAGELWRRKNFFLKNT